MLNAELWKRIIKKLHLNSTFNIQHSAFIVLCVVRVTVHTPWQPTGFCRVSTADKVAPKGVFSTDCALKPAKGCWLSGGEVNDYSCGIMNHIFPWTLTVLSIIGAILNIRKKRSGFAFYTVANIGWICVNIYHGIYAQATLFIVFTGLSLWGWIEWGRKKWGRRDGIF